MHKHIENGKKEISTINMKKKSWLGMKFSIDISIPAYYINALISILCAHFAGRSPYVLLHQ